MISVVCIFLGIFIILSYIVTNLINLQTKITKIFCLIEKSGKHIWIQYKKNLDLVKPTFVLVKEKS